MQLVPQSNTCNRCQDDIPALPPEMMCNRLPFVAHVPRHVPRPSNRAQSGALSSQNGYVRDWRTYVVPRNVPREFARKQSMFPDARGKMTPLHTPGPKRRKLIVLPIRFWTEGENGPILPRPPSIRLRKLISSAERLPPNVPRRSAVLPGFAKVVDHRPQSGCTVRLWSKDGNN